MQLITRPYQNSDKTPSSGHSIDNEISAFPRTNEIIVQEKFPLICRLSILLSAVATGKIQQPTDEFEMHKNVTSSLLQPSTTGRDVSWQFELAFGK